MLMIINLQGTYTTTTAEGGSSSSRSAQLETLLEHLEKDLQLFQKELSTVQARYDTLKVLFASHH